MKRYSCFLMAVGLLGCNVESKDESTGGVDARGTAICPAGMISTLSDYMSSQVALLDPDGNVLSDSFLSSGSESPGLSTPFSGDLVAPSTRSVSGEIALIDRFGTNVLSFIDPETAEVRAQLPVGMGFESNPYDYLELSKTKAYVARFGENADPGKEDFDQGGDILIVDPSVPSVVSSIELPRESKFPPAPAAITLKGETAIVVLQRFDGTNFTQGQSELVGIDTQQDSVTWSLVLEGKKSCGRAELSPSGKVLAVSCTGSLDLDGAFADAKETGILLFDVSAEPPVLTDTISVVDALDFSSQGDISFASETVVLGKTQTPYGKKGNNKLFALDLESGEFQVLLEAADDGGVGKGVVYNGLKCGSGCSDVCLLADADTGSLRRFDAKTLEELDSVEVGSSSGLPPVGLGPF